MLVDLIRLFTALVCERSVLFLCDNLSVLTSCVLATVPLLRPFAWQGVFVPLLPAYMQDCLEVPVPYLIGATSVAESRTATLDAVVVDLQLNRVRNFGPPLCVLPEVSKLSSRLQPLHNILFARGRAIPSERPTPKQLLIVPQIQEVVSAYIPITHTAGVTRMDILAFVSSSICLSSTASG